jgi:hypothetical protein
MLDKRETETEVKVKHNVKENSSKKLSRRYAGYYTSPMSLPVWGRRKGECFKSMQTSHTVVSLAYFGGTPGHTGPGAPGW